MKSILLGGAAAVIIAFGAYAVLERNFQQSAEQRHTTSGARP